jgi:anti-sigma factor RsiW
MLSRYLDKEIRAADAALVEVHLDNCPGCKKELSGLLHVKRLMLEKAQKTLPEGFLIRRLREKIVSETYVKQEPLWLADMGALARRFIQVPAPVIILLLVFLMFNSRQQVNGYSLEDYLLSGTKTTTTTALELILEAKN